jgi:hypothetical protein
MPTPTPTFTPKTFPGVYSQIVDRSFFTPSASRFKPGLIGVASKGPMNEAIVVQSLKDFVTTFGSPIPTTYTTNSTTGLQTPDNNGYFLADAVDAIADFTNSITVVRVGNTYTKLAPEDAASGANGYTIYDPYNAPRVQAFLAQGNDVFLRVTQEGMASTVNVEVDAAGGGTISLDPTGDTLAAGYTAGELSYSFFAKAANQAEGILQTYTYGSNAGQLIDAVFTSVGSISGFKNQFQFYVASNATAIAAGDVFKIKQTNKASTHEARVHSVLVNYTDTSGTVYLEKTDNPQLGYQALPLQDNYTVAALFKPTGKKVFLYLKAATEGSWANGQDNAQGLYTKVRVGSKPGTKKLEVYWNSALVETHDNLTDDATDATNYWAIRLAKGVSNYVYIDVIYNPDEQNWTAANTVAPWDARFFSGTATPGLPKPMPFGAINAGDVAVTVGNVVDTGGQFNEGFNGENPQEADWIGTLDPTTDKLLGIRAFENKRKVDINVLALPVDNVSLGVLSQLGNTCNQINAVSVADIPAALNGRQAIDWHNGSLIGQSGKLDSHNVAVFWNWFQRSNRFGETKLVPPTIGWLRCAAFTFNSFAPWYAIAGETRGYLPEAEAVQFRDVSDDTLQAMYGNGNSVNPILDIQGRFFIYGERTMQRLESKLTAIHSVICVNWTVNGMAQVARRFVFDPNDAELLDNLRLSFSEFLDRIVNERGLEQYELVIDTNNNTPDTRNRREVIVDIALIPTDTAERIYINATVNASGAKINNIG